MHEKFIEVTDQRTERAERVPVLSILAVFEEWDWRQERNPDGTLGPKRNVYIGTKIASHRHQGWLVKERAKDIEARIDREARGNKHYLGECGPECCFRPWVETRKKRAA